MHPAAITSELDRIRRQAAELDSQTNFAQGKELAPRVRATLANLVLLVTDEFPQISQAEIDRLVGELCISHPARFFVVNYTGSSTEPNAPLSTTVSSRCVLAKNGMRVCSEEVTLNVSAERVSVIPNLLLSLFVPDIECVLLLLSDVSKNSINSESFLRLFSGLTNISDVLICDSGGFGEFAKGLSVLDEALQLPAAPGFRGAIQRDMSWVSLARWRALIAEQFDAIQADPENKKVSRVVLSFSVPKNGPMITLPTQVQFLIGWIAAKLGWNFSRVSSVAGSLVEFEFIDGDMNIVYIGCQPEQVTNGQVLTGCSSRLLRSISIILGVKEKNTELRIERTQDLTAVDLSIRLSAENSILPNACDIDFRRVPFSDPTLEQLVIAALAPQAIDRDFLLARERVLRISKDLR